MIQFLSRTEVWVLGLASAAFLVLYWAMRGAPIGQAAEEEGNDSPRSGYRDRVIAAVAVGLLLIGAGAFIALTRSILWSIPAFGLGFGVVLTLISVNRRYRHVSPGLRRTLDFSNTALTATLVAGVLIMVNVLAFRYGGRPLDLTEEGAFSLSTLTKNQLSTLNRPVTFTVFFGEGERSSLQAHRVRQLLDVYEAANPQMIQVEVVNPYREPEKFEAVAKRVPDVVVAQGGGVLLEYGEGEKPEHIIVRNNDLFETGRGDEDSFLTTFHGEDAVTSALMSLREGKKPKIVFTTGHGETSGGDTDVRTPSIGIWKSRLSSTGAEIAEVNLLRDAVPEQTALLVVVAPKTPFKADEVAKIRSYSDSGGPLLFLMGSQEKTGLEDFLKSLNVEFGKGMIVDRGLNLRGRMNVVYVPVLPGQSRHPIIDSLSQRVVLMASAVPLHVTQMSPTTTANSTVMTIPILKTTNTSWAETDLTNRRVELDRKTDEPGPLTVGVVVSDRPAKGETKDPKPRLVLFSCGALADNFFLEAEPTNLDLVMNSISWLRGRSDLQGIAPTTHKALTLAADPVLRVRLILVPTVMSILLIVGLGLTTYLARRQ